MLQDIAALLPLYLVSHVPLGALCWVSLAIVNACLHHPLIVESSEPARLIEQLMYKLIRAIWLYLQVYTEKLYCYRNLWEELGKYALQIFQSKLIIILFNDPILCIIFTSINSMSNLCDLTSKFHAVAIFLVVDVYIIVYTEFHMAV